MSLIYTLIAREKIILVDYTSKVEISSNMHAEYLNFQKRTRQNKSIINLWKVCRLQALFLYQFERELCVPCYGRIRCTLCLTQYEMRAAVDFLKRIQDLFFRRFSQRRRESATAYSLNEFKPILYDWMQKYSKVEEVDKLEKIKIELTQLQKQSLKNMNRIIENGGKISQLIPKGQELSDKTLELGELARKYKRHIWWQNKKLVLGIAALLIILLVIVLVLLLR